MSYFGSWCVRVRGHACVCVSVFQPNLWLLLEVWLMTPEIPFENCRQLFFLLRTRFLCLVPPRSVFNSICFFSSTGLFPSLSFLSLARSFQRGGWKITVIVNVSCRPDSFRTRPPSSTSIRQPTKTTTLPRRFFCFQDCFPCLYKDVY